MNHRDRLRIEAAEAQGWQGPWRFGNIHLHGTPPGSKAPATGWVDDKHVPDLIDSLIKRLYDQVEILSEGINAVRDLISESVGVAGLHRNGELAPWAELEGDGRFSDWLCAFNQAEEQQGRYIGCNKERA